VPPQASLDPALVVRAYREGIPNGRRDGGWLVLARSAGVLPLDTFHVPSRLARVIRSGRFEVTADRTFEAVMRACADRPDDGTWISDEIVECYLALHRLGIAHSIEIREGGELVGGLYGVHLGAAFFGESMFHRVRDASKVALAALVERLTRRGFLLLDTQWVAPLERFGAGDSTPRLPLLVRWPGSARSTNRCGVAERELRMATSKGVPAVYHIVGAFMVPNEAAASRPTCR
jgi:leucyl/phenylalanyl-tRNA--protein transferase